MNGYACVGPVDQRKDAGAAGPAGAPDVEPELGIDGKTLF